MINPRQDITNIMNGLRLWQRRPVNHDDGKADRPCGVNLRARAIAPGIFGDDQIDAVRAHQGKIARQREGAAIHDQMMARQRGGQFGRIDEAEQVMMLRLGGEGFDMHTPKGQHDAPGGTVERPDSAADIGHMGPAVALPCLPRRAGEHQMGRARLARGRECIRADRRGEGMGGIDKVGDPLGLQIGRQSSRATKAADAHRYGLLARAVRASGIAQHGAFAPLGEGLSECARFSRAAQDQDVAHGG